MSYEGVEQLLCEKGHYSVHDVHSPHKPDICFCGARFVWMNSVDYTNGTHDEDGNRIDGYVELELSDLAVEDNDPTQEEIEGFMTKQEHVKQLVQQIRANKGLTDPVLVRKRDNVVLEGNSRLAAYRILARENPQTYAKLRCEVIDVLDEEQFNTLLSRYHIIGKKDWDPYEQAGFFYRQVERSGISASSIARNLGVSPQSVNHKLAVYRFMVSKGENTPSRWSFYDEYLKNRDIQRVRGQYPQCDDTIVRKIRNREIPKADDIRSKVKTICRANPSIIEKFVNNEIKMDVAYEESQSVGADDANLKRLENFKNWIQGRHVEEYFLGLEGEIRKKTKHEIKKIFQTIKTLKEKLDQ